MNTPSKALILAAGFGTRMLPLSLDLPKPMMPIWGRPILDHVLTLLRDWGVTDALINLHHQPDAIVQQVRTRPPDGLRINLSFEPDILGTGGALDRAGWFLDEAPFWMINADVAADLSPTPLLRAFAAPRTLAALWLHPALGPRTVEMKNGRITNFRSSRPGTEGTYTFCGLQLLNPAIRRFIPHGAFSSIVDAYDRAMQAGYRIAGACAPASYWADIGTPDGYLKTHADVRAAARCGQSGARLFDPRHDAAAARLRRRGVMIDGFAALGDEVTVAPGARLARAVIWDGSRIAADAEVTDAIVGRSCAVRGCVRKVALRSDLTLQDGTGHDPHLALTIGRLRWAPARTTIVPFEPRGSARCFTRIEQGRRTAIMVRYSLEREENALYTGHARFLKSIGWPVPDILLDTPGKQLAVIEDLGDRSLQRMVEEHRKAGRPTETRGRAHDPVPHWYRRVLADVAVLHGRGSRAARRRRLVMVPPFDADLYRWEREFFARHYLDRQAKLTPGARREIMAELAGVANVLLAEPLVLVHRDLQSSNVLWKRNRSYFIDFQGMRWGAAAYDLASLLCDPYVELPLELQRRLLAAYNGQVSRGARVEERVFWLGAIERLAQALGAYGRLGASPETAWFRRYVPPALRMLARALEQADVCPTLRAVIDRAVDRITVEY